MSQTSSNVSGMSTTGLPRPLVAEERLLRSPTNLIASSRTYLARARSGSRYRSRCYSVRMEISERMAFSASACESFIPAETACSPRPARLRNR